MRIKRSLFAFVVVALSSCAHGRSSPVPSPDIAERPGAPVSTRVVRTFKSGTDFHIHVQSQQTGDVHFNGARALIAVESAGLGRAWILSQAFQKQSEQDARRENDFVITEARKNPSRLVATISVPPKVAWAEQEVVRAHSAGGKALKLHSMATGLDLTKSNDLAVFEELFIAAEREGVPIVVHGAFHRPGEAQALVDLAERHPKIRIVIGHMLGRDFPLLASLRGKHIFVEMSVVPFFVKTDQQRASVVETIRKAGTWRFVFGSDWPVVHPAETLLAIERLPLTNEEREAILARNAHAFDDLFEAVTGKP